MRSGCFALLCGALAGEAQALDWGAYGELDLMYQLELFDAKVERRGTLLGRFDESRGVPAWGLEAGLRLGPVWLRGSYNSSTGFSTGEAHEDLQSYWVDAYVKVLDLSFMSGSRLGVKVSRFDRELEAPGLFDYRSTHNNLVLLFTAGVMDFDLLVSPESATGKRGGFFFSAGLGLGNYDNAFHVRSAGPLQSFHTENLVGPLFAVYLGGIYKGDLLYAGGSMGVDLVLTGDGFINGEEVEEAGTVVNISGVAHATAGLQFAGHLQAGLEATWRTEKTDVAQEEQPAGDADLSHALIYSFLFLGYVQVVY